MIQVFGCKGMLGRALYDVLCDGRDGFWLESTRLEEVTARNIHCPVVINCAGIVKQRTFSDSSFILSNGYGPQRLADVCNIAHARLIHISTDCVFESAGPHDECDTPDAQDIYALSKRIGEVTRPPHLTIRTSFVGKQGGLLHDLMHSQEVTASDRLLWTGHTVETIANLLVTLAEREDISGLLHVPAQEFTRLELVTLLKEVYHLDVKIKRDDSFVADRRLTSLRWERLGLPKLPELREQLHDN